MADKSGVSPQSLALPQGGGGAIGGLGTGFEPDLHLGSGAFQIPLEVPGGPGRAGPRLELRYHTGAPAGPFGLGWSLGLLQISRSTSSGVPSYQATDPLEFSLGGELAEVAPGLLRPLVDRLNWRIERAEEGFVCTDPEGTRFMLGTSPGSRLVGPAGQVLAWLIEAAEDTDGNRTTFTYRQDGGQLYIERVAWSIYALELTYESRPDPFATGRPGWLLVTNLRCREVSLLVPREAQPAVRRWRLHYGQAAGTGHSLLAGVEMAGVGPDGSTVAARPLALGYTGYQPVARLEPVTAPGLPALQDRPNLEAADLTGDGLADLVRVYSGLVEVWPGTGAGRWASPHVIGPDAGAPVLPARYAPGQVYLTDLDGDGCADLVYIDRERVHFWLGRQGFGFGPETIVAATPPLGNSVVRLLDLSGGGTRGILWSYRFPGLPPACWYLDFSPAAKPYLLDQIDQGLGATTRIGYGTSIRARVADRAAGQPWQTFLPFPVQTVARVDQIDRATGLTRTTHYRYHDGHFDGNRREFLGFGRVEVIEEGDESIPALRTTTSFDLGVDLYDPDQLLPDAARRRRLALKGTPLQRRVEGLDAGGQPERLYTVTTFTWSVATLPGAAGTAYCPRLERQEESDHEGSVLPWRTTVLSNESFDSYGNVLAQRVEQILHADPGRRRVVRTSTSFAVNTERWIIAKPARRRRENADGVVLSAQVLCYDGLPEGQVETGFNTTELRLAYSDALVTRLFGDSPPDWAGLSYVRLPGEEGWWVEAGRASRSLDPAAPWVETAGPLGEEMRVEYDSDLLFPVQARAARGNTTGVEIDYRLGQYRRLTDANGNTTENRYDALGRVVAQIEPGDSDLLPTAAFRYDLSVTPVQVVSERRVHNRRGLVHRLYLPVAATDTAYAMPDAALPHVEIAYDALGRTIRRTGPDGSVRRDERRPGELISYDEEDTATGPAAPHRDTPRIVRYDAASRVAAVVLRNRGRAAAAAYEHDEDGRLVSFTDAKGRTTRVDFDLLGRKVRIDSPASGTVLHIFDAAGNERATVNGAGERTEYLYDRLNRLIASRLSTGQAETAVTYVDAADLAPGEAPGNRLGRVARIRDALGETDFTYDARGRMVEKLQRPTRLPGVTLRYNIAYDRLGRVNEVTYPAFAGSSRRVIRYLYGNSGLLESIPGWIRRITYNAQGKRERVEFANGVTTTYSYYPDSLRLQTMTTTGPAGVLQRFDYAYDRVGNLTRLADLEPTSSYTLAYDDLYQLVSAVTDSGETLGYQFDDTGDLLARSDMPGQSAYGERGNNQAAMTSLGATAYDYDGAGRLIRQAAPSGERICRYDARGRLTRVELPGGAAVACDYDHEGKRCARRTLGGEEASEVLFLDGMVEIWEGQPVFHVAANSIRFASFTATAVAFLHTDHLGSVRLVTDATGQVAQRMSYDPFGRPLPVGGGSGGSPSPGLEPVVPATFSGQPGDPLCEWVWFPTRVYDPVAGRFISPDVQVPRVFDPRAWNLYGYVLNNPLTLIDPLGAAWYNPFSWDWGEIGDAILTGLEWAGRALLTVATLAVAALAAPILGLGFTIFNIAYAFYDQGLWGGLAALLNSPFDLFTNTLGWFAFIGFYPLYAGTKESPSVGWVRGSLVFKGGPIGHIVSTFASGFTPTSTIFISGQKWERLDDDRRDRLINHELWHARNQFKYYTGWVFWPAYIYSNIFIGTHRGNPFESGENGPYTTVDEQWNSGYQDSPDYVDGTDPFWF